MRIALMIRLHEACQALGSWMRWNGKRLEERASARADAWRERLRLVLGR